MTGAVLALYLDTFSPFIWEITPGFGMRWYGCAYVLAFAVGYFVYHWLSRRGYSEVPPKQVGDFIIGAALFGVLLGGRLGQMLLYDLKEWLHDPLMIFRVWEGGMASHGGILGLTLFTLWYARRHHLSWTSIGDNLCVVAPIGLFFGRLANFINGELWGRIAPHVSWAVQFPREIFEDRDLLTRASDALQTYPTVSSLLDKWSVGEAIVKASQKDAHVQEILRGILPPRYPSQLIEAALEGVILFAVLWSLRTLVRVPRGVISGVFFILYAVLRIIGEQFREPESDSPFVLAFGFLTYGQFLSLFLILIGAAFIIWGCRAQQYERALQKN